MLRLSGSGCDMGNWGSNHAEAFGSICARLLRRWGEASGSETAGLGTTDAKGSAGRGWAEGDGAGREDEGHLGGLPDEERTNVIAVGLAKTAASLVEVLLLAFDTDEAQALFERSNARGPSAHVRINHGASDAKVLKRPCHDRNRLLGRVNLAGVITICERIAAQDARVTVDTAPCLLALCEIAIAEACALIPNEETPARRQCEVVSAPDNGRNVQRENGSKVGGFIVPCQILSNLDAAILANACACTNPIRRISHDSIDLAERRQDVPAVAQIEFGAPDVLYTHPSAPPLKLRLEEGDRFRASVPTKRILVPKRREGDLVDQPSEECAEKKSPRHWLRSQQRDAFARCKKMGVLSERQGVVVLAGKAIADRCFAIRDIRLEIIDMELAGSGSRDALAVDAREILTSGGDDFSAVRHDAYLPTTKPAARPYIARAVVPMVVW